MFYSYVALILFGGLELHRHVISLIRFSSRNSTSDYKEAEKQITAQHIIRFSHDLKSCLIFNVYVSVVMRFQHGIRQLDRKGSKPSDAVQQERTLLQTKR